MARWMAFVAMGGLSGCVIFDQSKSDDTACTGTCTDWEEEPTAPYQFDDTTVADGIECSGTEAGFSFDFLGEASQGLIDVADSGHAPNWNETHTLMASGFTADGGYSLLEAIDIRTAVAVEDWDDGTATVFWCSDHFDEPVMSYAVRAYDLNGGLADCLAWGHDPEGMLNGDYFNYNTPIDQAEFASCRTLVTAR